MKFWEAIKEFEEGKRIRCKSWASKDFWAQTDHHNSQRKWMWDDCHYRVMRMMEEEWELYEEPVQTYKFWELIPALKEGKKIKRKETDVIIFLKNTFLFWKYDNNDALGMRYLFTVEDFEADDWVICE